MLAAHLGRQCQLSGVLGTRHLGAAKGRRQGVGDSEGTPSLLQIQAGARVVEGQPSQGLGAGDRLTGLLSLRAWGPLSVAV